MDAAQCVSAYARDCVRACALQRCICNRARMRAPARASSTPVLTHARASVYAGLCALNVFLICFHLQISFLSRHTFSENLDSAYGARSEVSCISPLLINFPTTNLCVLLDRSFAFYSMLRYI